MKSIKKYLIISLMDLILIIPILFGFFTQYLLIQEINLQILLVIFIGFCLFLALSKIIQILGYDENTIKIMRQHDVTAIFIEKGSKLTLFVFFPLTILMEELIFRFYLIGLIIYFLNINIILIILISSVIFSLYHLHFWFRFRNIRITLIFMVSSFIMGIFLVFILITVGLYFCIAFHLLITLFAYYSLAKKIIKRSIS